MKALLQLLTALFAALGKRAPQKPQEAPQGSPASTLPGQPVEAPPGATTSLLRVDLRRDEGVRTKVYKDTAVPPKDTIGVGHNIDADTHTPRSTIERWRTHGLDRGEAGLILEADIAIAEAELDRVLSWWRTLDPVRRDVLANMMFNMGAPVLLGFKNTLRFIRTGDYEAAAAGMLASKWARQVGKRADRLAGMMRTGSR